MSIRKEIPKGHRKDRPLVFPDERLIEETTSPDGHRALILWSKKGWYILREWDNFYGWGDRAYRTLGECTRASEEIVMPKSRDNGRAGVERIVIAFLEGRSAREGRRPDYKAGNRYFTDGKKILQWGNLVAEKTGPRTIRITDAGWKSVTTKALLNEILRRVGANAHISQAGFQWYIGGKVWRGEAVISLDGGSVEANRTHRQRRKTRERRHRKWFVSLYRTSRAYGGPEEGGWWYGTGEPLKSQAFATRGEAERFRAKYDEEVAAWKKRHTWPGDDKLMVRIERQHPREWPQYRPRYENNKSEGKEYRLGSSPMIHAPGVVRWIKAGYSTSRGKQRELFATLISKTWAGVPPKIGRAVAAGLHPYTVEGETVVVKVPGGSGKMKCNPLSVSDSKFLLHQAARSYGRGRSGRFSAPWSAFLMGKAQGRASTVATFGPKRTVKMAGRLSERIDAGMKPYREPPSPEYSARMAALPNPLRALKNLHTAREREYAKKLIRRYWESGKAAIVAGSRDKAAHAYGALAAIRRIAQFELPHAKVVSTLATIRMENLRQSARDMARYRAKR